MESFCYHCHSYNMPSVCKCELYDLCLIAQTNRWKTDDSNIHFLCGIAVTVLKLQKAGQHKEQETLIFYISNILN